MSTDSKFVFNTKTYSSRIKKILDFWEADSILQKVHAIALSVGTSEILTYNKSSAAQEWLFGYDLNDTVMIITKKNILLITGKKKSTFLEPVKKSNSIIHHEIITRNKGDSAESEFKKIINQIKTDLSVTTVNLGVFDKDIFEGEFIKSWYSFISTPVISKIDISAPFSSLLAVKDEEEMALTKFASSITCDIYSRYIRNHILDIIDGEKKVKHFKLSEDFESTIESTKYIPKNVSLDELEVSYPPIIQSGEKCNLKFSAISDKNNLEFDSVVCFFGIRYKYYCSSMIRTLMVQPTEELKNLYTYLLKIYDIACSKIKEGNKFSDSFNAVYDEVSKTYPQYLHNFVKNIGFVTGLEFRESMLVLDSKNTAIIKKGMIFCTLIGFQNVPLSNNRSKPISIAIGDTIMLSSDDTLQVYTSQKKNLGSSMILLNENKLEDSTNNIEEEIFKKAPAILPDRKRQNQIDVNSNEEQRKAHQAELKKKLNDEAKRRLLMNEGTTGKRDEMINRQNISSYKSVSALPKENDIYNLKIFVDKQAETVILPIFGMSVPFHISTIKSVSSNAEGNHTYLRINFNVIINSTIKSEDLSISYGKNVYVKEMIYRSSNIRDHNDSSTKSSNITAAFNSIKDMQKVYKSRVLEEIEMEGVVKQADLILNPSKNVPRLKDLVIRPQLSNRRVSGVLEAHTNGFRYVSSRGETVDILYKNIKHAIFQPCDGEVVITLHFHLKSPIIIGKKKYKDIQCFTEVGEIASDLGKVNSSMLDRDEIEAEESEREARNKLKLIFKSFVDKVEAITNNTIEFEVPVRELGFQGVPFKSSVTLIPSTHCLINIIDQPPFIITLDEVELVHFERVIFHMKQFDMVIIFKDYNRKVCNISCVPMNSLDTIKEWLNSCDIKYTESTQNLNWAKIMKTILDDPEEFFAIGGWSFLDPDSGEDEEPAEEIEPDEEYRPDESSEELIENSGSDSEDYESENSGSEESQDESSVDTESGKSWSELEEEAKALDAMKHGEFSPSHGKRKSSANISSSKMSKPRSRK